MPPMQHTDWNPLREYLRQKNTQPGERIVLTSEDLAQILSPQSPPPSVSRVTLWDPIMGKSGTGLQGVMCESELIPVAFEWEGSQDDRPRLRWVILQRWGSGVGGAED